MGTADDDVQVGMPVENAISDQADRRERYLFEKLAARFVRAVRIGSGKVHARECEKLLKSA